MISFFAAQRATPHPPERGGRTPPRALARGREAAAARGASYSTGARMRALSVHSLRSKLTPFWDGPPRRGAGARARCP